MLRQWLIILLFALSQAHDLTDAPPLWVFDIDTTTDSDLHLSTTATKLTFIAFWAPWDEDSTKLIEDWKQAYTVDPTVRMITIALDDKEDTLAYVKKHDCQWIHASADNIKNKRFIEYFEFELDIPHMMIFYNTKFLGILNNNQSLPLKELFEYHHKSKSDPNIQKLLQEKLLQQSN